MRIEKTVLLVDDDPDDIELLQEALRKIDQGHTILTAKDGVEALRQLNELSIAGTLPCLVVLDINMPKMDGRQTFVAIRSNEKFSKLPIVIFSTSSSMLDKTFFEKANTAYFEKPVNFKAFIDTASRLINYCTHRIDRK